jgi:hypothetical protein
VSPPRAGSRPWVVSLSCGSDCFVISFLPSLKSPFTAFQWLLPPFFSPLTLVTSLSRKYDNRGSNFLQLNITKKEYDLGKLTSGHTKHLRNLAMEWLSIVFCQNINTSALHAVQLSKLQSLHVDREQPNVPRLYLANGPCWAGLGRAGSSLIGLMPSQPWPSMA